MKAKSRHRRRRSNGALLSAHIEEALSPDGRWPAYASNESGEWEEYVQPFPTGRTRMMSTQGGSQPYAAGWKHVLNQSSVLA